LKVSAEVLWVPAKFFQYASRVRNFSGETFVDLKQRIRSSVLWISFTFSLSILVTLFYVGYSNLVAKQGRLEQQFASHFGLLNNSVWPFIFFCISESTDSVIKVRFENFNTRSKPKPDTKKESAIVKQIKSDKFDKDTVIVPGGNR
jgi:hypothetical protein